MYCVYCLEINNECYVGSTNNLKQRVKSQRSRTFNPKSKHYNSKFCQYVRNNGFDKNLFQVKNYKILVDNIETKAEAREMEQVYISSLGTLNGRMEINKLSNAENCKKRRKENYEKARQRETAYSKSEKGKTVRKAWRDANKERQKELVTCEKCGHQSTRKHISDHRRKGLCI